MEVINWLGSKRLLKVWQMEVSMRMLLLVLPLYGRNEILMKSMKGSGIDSIENEWGKLFDMKSNFFVWKHQEWVEYVTRNFS
jgi:hypothetical protein